MPDVVKLIKVQDDTYMELTKLATKYGETMNEIVAKCIRAYKEKYKK